MRVTLPEQKCKALISCCKAMHKSDYATIREVAQLLGLIVSVFPAVRFGKLYYRALEIGKIAALQSSKRNFDAYMYISKEMKAELYWWITEVKEQYRDIYQGTPDFIIQTDSSLKGWGCIF